MRRRDYLTGMISLGVLGATSACIGTDSVLDSSISATEPTLPPLPDRLNQYVNNGSFRGALGQSVPFGNSPPGNKEEELAREVINLCPANKKPVEIAQFFVGLSNGDFGEEYRPYAREWPEIWNPVIVEFFSSTHTKPSGDVTPWCAAFVNWCILRAKSDRTPSSSLSNGSRSASSGSFRSWGEKIHPNATADLGDVVVFERTDPILSAKGFGHVGFYLQQTDDLIHVLGGNQLDAKLGYGSVNKKWFKKRGSLLKLHSIRHVDIL